MPMVGLSANTPMTAMHAEEMDMGMANTVRTRPRPRKDSLARIAQIRPSTIEPVTTIAAYRSVTPMENQKSLEDEPRSTDLKLSSPTKSMALPA